MASMAMSRAGSVRPRVTAYGRTIAPRGSSRTSSITHPLRRVHPKFLVCSARHSASLFGSVEGCPELPGDGAIFGTSSTLDAAVVRGEETPDVVGLALG
jgi:hypothetical protein